MNTKGPHLWEVVLPGALAGGICAVTLTWAAFHFTRVSDSAITNREGS